VHSKALKNAIDLTAKSPNAIAKSSIATFFSRAKPKHARLVRPAHRRHGESCDDAIRSMSRWTSAALDRAGGDAFCHSRGHPDPEVNDAEKRQPRQACLFQRRDSRKVVHQVQKRGRRPKVAPIPILVSTNGSSTRIGAATNKGHVFFVHAKVLLSTRCPTTRWFARGRRIFSKNSLTVGLSGLGFVLLSARTFAGTRVFSRRSASVARALQAWWRSSGEEQQPALFLERSIFEFGSIQPAGR